MQLAEFIKTHREEILGEWELRTQLPTLAGNIDRETFRNYASKVLEWNVNYLDVGNDSRKEIAKLRGDMALTCDTPGRRFLSTQLHDICVDASEFGIWDLVAIHSELRSSVLTLWRAEAEIPRQINLGELTRFSDAIDQCLYESVVAYSNAENHEVWLLESMLSSSPDFIFLLGPDGKFRFANSALARRFNLVPYQLIGMHITDLGVMLAVELIQQFNNVIHFKKTCRAEISTGSDIENSTCYEYVLTPIFRVKDEVDAVAGTLHDVTERKKFEKENWHKANFDLLTDLPNRNLFRDRLEQEVKHAQRACTSLALLFIDLDRFKETNDMFGHDVGDMLLRETATRIRSCVRKKDTFARLGGDEFTVILTDIASAKDVESIARKILKVLADPFHILQEIIHISGSIGITFYPDDALTPEMLVRHADQAMYASKKTGRNQFSFFTSRIQEETQTRYKLVADLRYAIARSQLEVYYQPIIDLTTGNTQKAEALLRWVHPELGLILPEIFIVLAEETGLIKLIDDWVFLEAVKQSCIWGELLGRPFQISVNRSPIDFITNNTTHDWALVLKEAGLGSGSIAVEITEGVLLATSDFTKHKLAHLHDIGVELAVDDFGTGYSSMSYLNKFDIDYLKIDQSFVEKIEFDGNSKTIVEAIILMAHKLGLRVIAEGVETEGQRSSLEQMGCDFAQGFFYKKPVPESQFTQFLIHGSSLQ